MSKAARTREAFRALLDAGGTIVAPGAYDPVSAMLIERAGFPVVYVGSYATAAARLGLPDVGIVTMEEMAEHAKAVADAIGVPVLADGENGWNNAANIWRTVRSFEQAGVCGIHIEDHEFGKHAPVKQVLALAEAMAQKIRAALDAREDRNFLVIARTDAAWAWGDVEEAVRRMNLYADAGADMVMAAGMEPKTLAAVRGRIRAKVMITDTKGYSVEDEDDGIRREIFLGDCGIEGGGKASGHGILRRPGRCEGGCREGIGPRDGGGLGGGRSAGEQGSKREQAIWLREGGSAMHAGNEGRSRGFLHHLCFPPLNLTQYPCHRPVSGKSGGTSTAAAPAGLDFVNKTDAGSPRGLRVVKTTERRAAISADQLFGCGEIGRADPITARHGSKKRRSRTEELAIITCEVMRAIRSNDTRPELIVRSLCHALGLRFRLRSSSLPGKPDLRFPKHHAVILVHGCFWHGHEQKNCRRRHTPRTNSTYWKAKLFRNRARDKRTEAELNALGWRVLVLWECEIESVDLKTKIARFFEIPLKRPVQDL